MQPVERVSNWLTKESEYIKTRSRQPLGQSCRPPPLGLVAHRGRIQPFSTTAIARPPHMIVRHEQTEPSCTDAESVKCVLKRHPVTVRSAR